MRVTRTAHLIPHTHIAQQRPLLQSSLRACIGASPSGRLRRHAAMESPSSALMAAPDTRTPADPPPPLRSPVVATVARREAISEEEEKENPGPEGQINGTLVFVWPALTCSKFSFLGTQSYSDFNYQGMLQRRHGSRNGYNIL
ncbi:unnamed protein product [Urochloa humidicola]